jgi:dCTP diphosphatase
MTEVPSSPSLDLASLQGRIREFVRERDWEQFHAPKNLVLALVAELGELAEIFHVKNVSKPQQVDQHVGELFSNVRGRRTFLHDPSRLVRSEPLELLEACDTKLELNRERYPVKEFRGRAGKYSKE